MSKIKLNSLHGGKQKLGEFFKSRPDSVAETIFDPQFSADASITQNRDSHQQFDGNSVAQGDRDLASSARSALSHYASEGINNNILHPFSEPSDAPQNNRGNPILSAMIDGSNTFVNKSTQDAVNYLQTISAGSGLNLEKKKLDKTGKNLDENGHEFLKNVSATSDIKKTVFSRGINRFGSGDVEGISKEFIPNESAKNEEDAFPSGIFSIQAQNVLGKYSSLAKKVSIHDMNEATTEMLRSSAGLTPSGDGISASSVLTAGMSDSIQSLGLRVPQSKTRIAWTSVGKKATGGTEDSPGSKITNEKFFVSSDFPDDDTKYGAYMNLTSPDLKFENNVGYVAAAVRSIGFIAVGGLFLFGVFAALDLGNNRVPIDAEAPGNYEFGSAGRKKNFIYKALKTMGIPVDSQFSLKACLLEGFAVYLGMDTEKSKPKDLEGFKNLSADVMVRVVEDPMFYINLSRVIQRDIYNIKEAFLDLNKKPLVTSITETISQITKLTRPDGPLSKPTFRFYVTMAQLGAQSLRANSNLSNGLLTNKKNALTTPITPEIRMKLMKGVLPSGKIGSSLSLSSYERQILKTNDAFNVFSGKNDEGAVEKFEQLYDAEYMPFYMHDLRTNEAIGFPAFITAFTDSFAPEWTATSGYGRTDDVQIYSKTKRNVSLSFKMVAMNPDDFDVMWENINKLVTMVYPQRSAGKLRKYTDGENNGSFIQPFSQVPTASPVIRIRLGDLYRSNYSRSSFAKLFGHGKLNNQGFSLAVASDSELLSASEKLLKARQNAEEKISSAFIEQFKHLSANIFAHQSGITSGFSTQASTIVTVQDIVGDWYSIPFPLPAGTKFSIAQAISQFSLDDGKVRDYIVIDESSIENDTFKKVLSSDKFSQLKRVKYCIPTKNITFDAKAREEEILKDNDVKVATEELNKKRGNAPTAESFFNPSNNYLVKSFESTKGKGLACVITSLEFDYGGDVAKWNIDKDSRAPMFVTVALGLSIIHDLPLGLDSDGRMIAPSHAVGKIAQDYGISGKSNPYSLN